MTNMDKLYEAVEARGFLFIAHRLSKTSRIVDLFMEFATKNLSITKKQIQDRKVEFI